MEVIGVERYSPEELRRVFSLDQYPRASGYDPQLVIDNSMGPNVLWLTEALTRQMHLEPGMRVLDLGCGRAISSIFLAREFDVEVWAVDLWIDATSNWRRIVAETDHRIYPIHAEAHALPFAESFFDAVVCVDAYHYFGTDDLYLEYLSQFVKPGGELGMIAPGTLDELARLPAHLQPYWHRDFSTFHSPSWWSSHWRRSGVVDVLTCDAIPDGWKEWLLWCETCVRQGDDGGREQVEMVKVDGGRSLGFVRMVARRLEKPSITWSVPR